jgi:hypothetical protein
MDRSEGLHTQLFLKIFNLLGPCTMLSIKFLNFVYDPNKTMVTKGGVFVRGVDVILVVEDIRAKVRHFFDPFYVQYVNAVFFNVPCTPWQFIWEPIHKLSVSLDVVSLIFRRPAFNFWARTRHTNGFAGAKIILRRNFTEVF